MEKLLLHSTFYCLLSQVKLWNNLHQSCKCKLQQRGPGVLCPIILPLPSLQEIRKVLEEPIQECRSVGMQGCRELKCRCAGLQVCRGAELQGYWAAGCRCALSWAPVSCMQSHASICHAGLQPTKAQAGH